MTVELLINIDVDDLPRATEFYTRALQLRLGRRFGDGAVELVGGSSPIYLLAKELGSEGAPGARRSFDRHWTPVHLDVAVPDLDRALEQATAAGALVEQATVTRAWGRIAMLVDPFGHGLCLIEFSEAGYDAIAGT